MKAFILFKHDFFFQHGLIPIELRIIAQLYAVEQSSAAEHCNQCIAAGPELQIFGPARMLALSRGWIAQRETEWHSCWQSESGRAVLVIHRWTCWRSNIDSVHVERLYSLSVLRKSSGLITVTRSSPVRNIYDTVGHFGEFIAAFSYFLVSTVVLIVTEPWPRSTEHSQCHSRALVRKKNKRRKCYRHFGSCNCSSSRGRCSFF